MQKRKIPELLAPAGGWEQLRAAVQNGADAVYMGGPAFNARIRADNFTHQDMKDAVVYAHDRNVKLYVTLNTLVRDSELERAFSYINFLYGAGADALIIQDMGLLRLIRRYLPDMPVHMSTQGTLYNAEAVRWASSNGISRIVPARELSLQEIADMAAEGEKCDEKCEIEIFIHGAMCMCYSGQCHMSRLLGGINGRSGNRGLCAQPCRLPYRDSSGRRSFLLSPRDMCTLDIIPQICETGADSLKIEGRLKSAEYVAVVTSVYRKYLDMYRETGRIDITDEDRHDLLQIFSRGGFTTGYMEKNPGRKLLSGDSPKNQGIYAGRVKGIKKGSTLIDIEYDRYGRKRNDRSYEISIGDGVEIRGRQTAGNVITYIKKISENTFRIGDIKKKVYPGDKVFKVTDKELNEKATQSYRDDSSRKVPADISFSARKGSPARLMMTCGGYRSEVSGSMPVEKALKRPMDDERIRRQLGKLGGTVYTAANMILDTDPDIAIPVSELNNMRRAAAEELTLQRRTKYDGRTPLTEVQLADIKEKECLGDDRMFRTNPLLKKSLFIYGAEDPACISRADRSWKHIYIPLEMFLQTEHADSRIIPYVLNVSRGGVDEMIRKDFAKISDSVRGTGIMLGNPAWAEAFSKAGVKVYGGYGLNVYNSQSLRFFEENCIEIRAYSHEADGYCEGDIPLMITEHPVTSGTFTDRKGAGYRVMRWYSGDKYLVFAEHPVHSSADTSEVCRYVYMYKTRKR